MRGGEEHRLGEARHALRRDGHARGVQALAECGDKGSQIGLGGGRSRVVRHR